MKDGFIRVAAASVPVTVADTNANTKGIIDMITEADGRGVNLLVLPELCITGYSCGDLFFSDTLISSARDSLVKICESTQGRYPVVIVGAPLMLRGKLFNCAVVMHNGSFLGIVPKTHLPNYAEFYELRQFTPANTLNNTIEHIALGGMSVPFGVGMVFSHSYINEYCFGVEICEDLWSSNPPSSELCEMGATIIANLSASNEVIGKDKYRILLAQSVSARLICGYIYACAGPDESTQDTVFSGHNLIAENGTLLAQHKPFKDCGLLVSEIDVKRLTHDRHHNTGFATKSPKLSVCFEQKIKETAITRTVERNPFVPPIDDQINERAEAILKIQSYGLKKRLEHAKSKSAVIGISGGLDSTLALLVCARTMDLLKRPRTDIIAVTMPCFGTTKRTKSNAVTLCECLGVTLREIPIDKAVKQHFEDIGQRADNFDVTYENAQARERTQVLMDIANMTGGIVVGTGDLSELALGWATYNGDHMSMYGVNSSVPKTLVRYIVKYEAGISDDKLASVLNDILDTPVSPELLPAKLNGDIAQKTEDLVGPYELHDFFLYNMLRFGSSPAKVFRLAVSAFNGAYDDSTILKWLRVFVRRFFIQQFKRSCMPDGPKVGSVTLSPRGDWRMPSDASFDLWMRELDDIRDMPNK